MTVIRQADGTLLVRFSVQHEGIIGCGARTVVPGDAEYDELLPTTVDEATWAERSNPDHPANVRARAYLCARERAEQVRDFAVRLRDGQLLLPEPYWWEPHLTFSIDTEHPDYQHWARTAVPDDQWHRTWWLDGR
ncbi:hypothetical protein HUT06_21610 [Actinomadura sp. NAK00032]|uniref:hypothetical protein n=1 Tax=Actinomadura sp. NAK00032 TaxID=2742128 RepID=UPI00158FC479|nr:hypothetical protein [Actinomadura sp. NAK00032]QKW36308.1 hypothetical protein HUT06_21610 [Actinomadura sp. NAK00032]